MLSTVQEITPQTTFLHNFNFFFRQPQPNFGDEFRKPIWIDDCETDDELFDSNKIFGLQIFTNPLEMQKHFEQQMQEMLKSLDHYEGN